MGTHKRRAFLTWLIFFFKLSFYFTLGLNLVIMDDYSNQLGILRRDYKRQKGVSLSWRLTTCAGQRKVNTMEESNRVDNLGFG